MAKPLPTIERLRELLAYDPETGVLTWKVSINSAVPVGSVAGTYTSKGYKAVSVGGTRVMSHRLAWAIHYGRWPELGIDHIDGVKDNNCMSNLRDVSQSENMKNQRAAKSGSKSGLLGVFAREGCLSSPFVARICVEGKIVYLGVFKTAETAYAAYLAAKKTYHPESFLAQQQP